MADTTVLVETPDRSAAVVKTIMTEFEQAASKAKTKESYAVAVDLEGSRIGPAEGVLAVVTVGTPDGRVFLFDIAAMKHTAFTDGMLQVLLEHPALPKLWFDCRTDVAELHKYGIQPKCVVDLQVSCVQQFSPKGQFVMGLAKMLEKLRLGSPADAAVKKAGQKLFIPSEGGSYDVWFHRPLTAEMVAYAVVDVKHLFAARAMLFQREKLCLIISEKRVHAFSKPEFKSGDHMRYKDF
jgi:ribonuclease D